MAVDAGALLFDRLRRALDARAGDLAGVLAVTVIDLRTGARIAVNEDVPLGCGSSIKIPILMELYRQHAAGLIDLDAPCPVAPPNRVDGAGVLQFLRPDLVLTGRDLATFMIVLSDNTATNACIDLVGMERVQALLAELTPAASLVRKMQDYRAATRGLENVATASAMAEWVRLLWAGEFVSREVSDQVLRVLTYRKEGLINRALPVAVRVANKPGGLNGGKSDVGLVDQRRRPYVVSIMTAFALRGDGEETVVETARLVHDHMNALDRYKGMGGPHIEHFTRDGHADPALEAEEE
ncbi:MAG: serine hydrolase [Armatimonadota bacterium]|nr:serine hydrolase [Armatimonadota bacterium]MDR7488507.1 serine hydrolase [Armatimonadota bacterium]MDR7573802.1 serine hydrolase [Armatimonadota bacterium]MDR7586740.1 serine hydrolase [Armatimonadota bacterium]